jgi:hypothetical protein
VIIYFFQRYASFFAILAGLTAYRLVVPEDAARWLELSVALSITLVVYLLLYKDGTTANRPKKR